MRYFCHKHTKYQSPQGAQCRITNVSQGVHSAQPHTAVEIMKFPIFRFLHEILSNTFVCISILPIITQLVCSHEDFPICKYCKPNSEPSCQRVERVSVGTASSKGAVVYHRNWYTAMGYGLVKKKKYYFKWVLLVISHWSSWWTQMLCNLIL